MAIKSYDDMYMEIVGVNIGTMFEYANQLAYEPKEYWNMFENSYVAKQIEKGNPRFLAGFSAIDLLSMVTNKDEELKLTPFYTPSRFYWAGWAIANYQNYRGITFSNLNKILPIDEVLALYDPLHEADITKFYDMVDERIKEARSETSLKKIRTAAGLSQSALAKKADVSIRNIQMYEQRKNDINKAQGDILFKLSKVLGCNITDLFEKF